MSSAAVAVEEDNVVVRAATNTNTRTFVYDFTSQRSRPHGEIAALVTTCHKFFSRLSSDCHWGVQPWLTHLKPTYEKQNKYKAATSIRGSGSRERRNRLDHKAIIIPV